MRVILFLNNWGGLQVARWLKQRGEDIVGLVVQPDDNQRFLKEILAELHMPADRVWRAPQLRTPETLSQLRDLKPEIGVCAWFVYILKPELLRIFPKGCLNLHSAYLPWNCGWQTNVWPILDGSPAGVTVHYIDAGIDTGDILLQRRVLVAPTDTGGTLLQKLAFEMVDLFKSAWLLVSQGDPPRTPQNRANATRHGRTDSAALDHIERDKEYLAKDLINILRARTCPPYPAAFFFEGPKKVYIRVELCEEQAAASGDEREPFQIDLDKSYKAGELLNRLTTPVESGRLPAYFVSDSRRVYIRAELLSEENIDPTGSPAWMVEAN